MGDIMNQMKILFGTISSVLFSVFSYLFGGIDSSFFVLVIVMIFDYLTGICKAIYFKTVNSRIGIKGIIKKVGYFLIVSLSALLDEILDSNTMIRTFVIFFFIANEGISILENWGSMGLPLPKKLMEFFEDLKQKAGDENE